jgi:uncharacterized protein
LSFYIEVLNLLKKEASYEEYKQIVPQEEATSEQRWNLVRKSYTADVTEDLKKIKSPIYLILAEEDKNVNANETEQVYKKLLSSSLLSVTRIPKVNHSMINHKIANNSFLTTMTAIFFSRYLIEGEYLEQCFSIVKNYSK